MAKSMTEDAVRDLAREALGLVDSEIARAGVGQAYHIQSAWVPRSS